MNVVSKIAHQFFVLPGPRFNDPHPKKISTITKNILSVFSITCSKQKSVNKQAIKCVENYDL